MKVKEYTFDTFDDFITKLQLALGEILNPTFFGLSYGIWLYTIIR